MCNPFLKVIENSMLYSRRSSHRGQGEGVFPLENEAISTGGNSKGSPKILVVDDELDLLELFAKRLKNAGFDIVKACSGVQALEILKSSRFDAIICDINMPEGVSGFDVLAHVRSMAERKAPAFLFVTGHGEGTPEMEKALSLGVDGVYSKPISTRTLIEHLRKLCAVA
jgi:CheY-like chemotaxis protein